MDGRTMRAKIRDAAIERFPRDGFAATTFRAIADDVGGSPALVVHHFGSKVGLQEACDEYVVHQMAEQKRRATEQGAHRDGDAIASAYQLAAPLVRYLAWTLGTGAPASERIFDAVVDDVTRQLIEGERTGVVNAIEEHRQQAAVLVTFQLGGLVLHQHLSRAFGIDTLTPEGLLRVAPFALRILSGGLFDQQMMAEAAAGLEQAAGAEQAAGTEQAAGADRATGAEQATGTEQATADTKEEY